MSLRVHCDNCEKYMYETAPGVKWVPWARRQMGDWFFCSDDCVKAWASSIVDSPHAQPTPTYATPEPRAPRLWAHQVRAGHAPGGAWKGV